jgi:hypothetical protein
VPTCLPAMASVATPDVQGTTMRQPAVRRALGLPTLEEMRAMSEVRRHPSMLYAFLVFSNDCLHLQHECLHLGKTQTLRQAGQLCIACCTSWLLLCDHVFVYHATFTGGSEDSVRNGGSRWTCQHNTCPHSCAKGCRGQSCPVEGTSTWCSSGSLKPWHVIQEWEVSRASRTI